MVSRVWLINGVLAIALVICMSSIWDVWHVSTAVLSENRPGVNEKGVVQIKKSPESAALRESAYQNVVEKNLFSPDRAPAAPASEAVQQEIVDVRISGEKVVLYGVIMAGDYKKALINNPGDQKTGANNRWVSEGEQIGNLKVRQILNDEILLVDGSDSFRVLLYDPAKGSKINSKPARQSKEETQPKVITAGEKPRAEEKKTPKNNKFEEKKTISADGQYELIETPLGTIKRKRR